MIKIFTSQTYAYLTILNPGEGMEKQASSNSHMWVHLGNRSEIHSAAREFYMHTCFFQLSNPGTRTVPVDHAKLPTTSAASVTTPSCFQDS